MFNGLKNFKIFQKTFKLKHFGAGSYTNGKWSVGTATESFVVGSVQPMNGFDLMLIPEGERAKGSIRVKTDVLLQVADEKLKVNADQIEYNDHWYQVSQVQKWYGHYEAIAIRIVSQ